MLAVQQWADSESAAIHAGAGLGPLLRGRTRHNAGARLRVRGLPMAGTRMVTCVRATVP